MYNIDHYLEAIVKFMSEHKGPTETGKKLITLADLIDASKPIPQEYRIFQEHNPVIGAAGIGFPFSYFWGEMFPVDRNFEADSNREKAKHFFKEHLNQQVLVDLGGGQPRFRDRGNLSDRPMARFARDYGASAYVNVDTGHPEPIHEQDIEGLHLIEIREDMLSFVARMKDGSANFTLNGIHRYSDGDRRYFPALEKEIVRATRKGGIIFETESDVGFSRFFDIEQALLKRVKLDLPNYAFLYERI